MRGGLALSFVAGFAVMNSEIAAGRLFAPYYGTSTPTWALLIATILVSLSAGNLVGGALSRRDPAVWLVRLFALAAVMLAVAPRLGPWFMAGSLERFHDGNLQALITSACAALVLLAVPVACLGAVPPLLVHAAGTNLGRPLASELGRLSGRLSAAGTLGSLVGTLAAGLALIPWIGTTRTMDVGAGALVLAAAALAAPRARLLAVPAVTAAILVVLAARATAAPAVPAGKLIYSTESQVNHISVVDLGPERQLRVNDGYAVQSWVYRDGRLPLRDVWSFYAAAPAFSARPVQRVLLLGMGGGTAAELYRRLYPGVQVTGVELDPEMVRVGREQLGVRLDGVEVVIEDARTFVARAASSSSSTNRWDVIILDAFQFPYVPFHLTTREFFTDASRCLSPGGVLMVNAGRYGEHRDVVHAIEHTLASVFPHVVAADAPNLSNTIIVAGAHDPATAGVGVDALAASTPLFDVLALHVRRLPRMQPASWPADAPLLTDDHAPVEWLTDRILWDAL